MIDWPDSSVLPLHTPLRVARSRTIGDLKLRNEITLLSEPIPERRSRQRSVGGVIGAYREGDESERGHLLYELLESPALDETGKDRQPVLAIRVTALVVLVEFRGDGVVREALYDELRDSHPAFVIGADEHLTPGGKEVVTGYRATHPDIHVGRFDTDLTLHYTSGPDDDRYKPEHLVRS